MRGMAIAALGPDVLAGDFDSRQAASRAAVHNARAIGDVLLDQRVVAGIGNIWKCESLFAAGIDPRARTGSLTHDKLAQLYAAAHDLMTASVHGGRAPYRVYLQHQCAVCGSRIESAQLGEPPRWTWWCPGVSRLHPVVSGNRSRRGYSSGHVRHAPTTIQPRETPFTAAGIGVAVGAGHPRSSSHGHRPRLHA